MKVVVLCSGSKGNSTFIETTKNKILIDVGYNYKYICEKLKDIGVKPEEINYILISHTHSDHTSSLKTFLQRNNPTLVVSQKIFYEFKDLKDYNHVLIYEDEINLDGITIKAIHSSHDAVDSRNFIINDFGKTVCYVTDTGYINNRYFKELQNLNIYLFESNHDVELLQHGPYPAWLKRRVLSDEGHLSNNASSFYLSKLIGPNTKKIVLMHLSETNNMEEIALETIKNTFLDRNVNFDNIICAKQHVASEVIEV